MSKLDELAALLAQIIDERIDAKLAALKGQPKSVFGASSNAGLIIRAAVAPLFGHVS